MNRKDAIRRIRKCLRLASSPNPGEAATALRQAQKMMRAHDLTDADFAGVETAETIAGRMRNRSPDWAVGLANIIASTFACRALWLRGYTIHRGPRQVASVRFYGMGGHPHIAAYAYDVLRRQMDRDARRYLKRFRSKSRRPVRESSFRESWVLAVVDLVRSMEPSEHDKALIDSAIELRATGVIQFGRNAPAAVDMQARAAGFAAGSQAQLHRAVPGERPKALEKS